MTVIVAKVSKSWGPVPIPHEMLPSHSWTFYFSSTSWTIQHVGLQNLRFYVRKGKKKCSPLHCSDSSTNCDEKPHILSAPERVWYSLAQNVELVHSLLHVHMLWKEVSMHIELSFPISLLISCDLPVSSVQVYQQVLSDKWSLYFTLTISTSPVLLQLLEHSSNCLFYIVLSGTIFV